MDIETIGIAMDTSSVEQGNKTLDTAADKANRAADAADRLSNSNKTLAWQNQQMGQTAKTLSSSIEDQTTRAQALEAQMLRDAQAADTFMVKLKGLADAAGKSKTELLQQQAALHGVSEGAEQYISQIAAAEAGAHKFSLANAGVTRELGIMGGEIVRGNWTRLEGSTVVMANRMGLLQAAIASLTSPLGILIAGVLALTAAGVAAAIHYEHHAAQLNLLEVQLTATGRATMYSRGEIEHMISTLKLSADVSRDSAVQIISAYTKQYQIGHDLMGQLIMDTEDFAVATGQKAPEAAKMLAQAFADPAAGAKKLHEELGILSEAEVLNVEHLVSLGQTAQAQDILLQALDARVKGLAVEALGPLGVATRNLHEEWDKLMSKMGDTSAAQGANVVLVGLVNTLAKLVGYAEGSWADTLNANLKKIAVDNPWILLVPGAGMISYLAGKGANNPNQPDNRDVGGGWNPSSFTSQNQRTIDATVAANKGYQTQAEQLANLKEKLQGVDAALKLAASDQDQFEKGVPGYKDMSTDIDKLLSEYNGLKEAIAHAKPSSDALSASMEKLRAAGEAVLEQAKAQIDHFKALEQQGYISKIQLIEMEGDATMNAIDVKGQYLQQELKLAKTQTDRQKILDQIVKNDEQYKKVEQETADAIEVAWSNVYKNSAKAYADDLNSRETEIEKINKQAEAIEQEIKGNQSNAEAINAVTLAHLQEQAARLISLGLYGDTLDAINREIAARERLAQDMAALDAKKASDKQAAEAEKAWENTDKKIEDGLENAILNGGGNAAKQLFKDMELWALKTVLRFPFQVIGQIGASILNPAAASATGSLGGSIGSSIGNALGINNLTGPGGTYDTILGALGGGSGLAGAGASAAEIAGTAASTSEGLLAAGASAEEAAAASTALAGSMEAAGAAATTFGAGATAALAAVPVVGWIAAGAAVLYGIFGGKGGGPKTESAFGLGVPGQYTGDAQGATTIGAGIQAAYGSAAGSLGLSATQIAGLGVFYSQDTKGTALSQLDIHSANYSRAQATGGIENVARGDAALSTAEQLSSMQDVFVELQHAIGQQGLTGELADLVNKVNPLTDSFDSMQAVLTKLNDISSFNTAIGALGPEFQQLTQLSTDSKEALIAAAGGVASLTNALTDYYNNFASDAQKQQNIAQSISTTLSKGGLSYSMQQILDMTRDQFTALVDGAIAMGAAGQKDLVSLLSVESAFNTLHPAVNGVTSSLNGATAAMQSWQDAYFASWAPTTSGLQSSMSSLQEAASYAFSGLADQFSKLFKGITDEVTKITDTFTSNPANVSLASQQGSFDYNVQMIQQGGAMAKQLAAQLPQLADAVLAEAQQEGVSGLQLRELQLHLISGLNSTTKPLQAERMVENSRLASSFGGSSSTLTFQQALNQLTDHVRGLKDDVHKMHEEQKKQTPHLEKTAKHTEDTAEGVHGKNRQPVTTTVV